MSSSDKLEKLTHYFQNHKSYFYKKGEAIIRPDDEAHSVYYIKKGYVRVYRITEWGDIKLQLIYKAGEVFPIFWTFYDKPSIEYFEAMCDTEIIKSPRTDFSVYLDKNPDVFKQVAQRVLTVLEISADRTDNLLFTDAYSRVIMRLLHMTKRFGEQNGNEVIIQAPVTQKDIAYSIGMTRETASRQLSKLERKRIITYKGHFIVIKNVEKLKEELADSHERKML